MTGDDADEFESVSGYLYTHYDCPACGDADEAEGDCQGDEMECQNCKAKFRIGTVR